MADDAEVIENAELELWQIIAKMHKAGVRYTVVYNLLKVIFPEILKTLELQGYCEDWLKQYNPPKPL